MRAAGCRRRARRIAWRAWRSASAVTAQVLTITAPVRPAAAAVRRITPDSNEFSRQPKVMTSLSCIGSALGQQVCVEHALKAQGSGPRHDHMAVLAPGNVEASAVELDASVAVCQVSPVRSKESGAGAAATSRGYPDAPLPNAQPNMIAIADRRDADIGALRK